MGDTTVVSAGGRLRSSLAVCARRQWNLPVLKYAVVKRTAGSQQQQKVEMTGSSVAPGASSYIVMRGTQYVSASCSSLLSTR